MSDATYSRMVAFDNGTHGALFGSWQLKSAFQPIFTLSSGTAEIAGFEALIRPFLAGRAASPATLFRTVKGYKRSALETIMRDLHMKNATTLPVQGALLFINIDPSAFLDLLEISQALASVRRQWAKTGNASRRLVCEITEGKAKSPALLFSLADTIRANGFKLAIDDYGAKDSDAARLSRLRPDIVKLDGSWITRLMQTSAGYGHAKDMVKRLAGLGIETVFEGIEELQQLELGEAAGATYLQGFALARPEIAPTSFAHFITPAVPKSARDALIEAVRHQAAKVDLAIGYGHRAA